MKKKTCAVSALAVGAALAIGSPVLADLYQFTFGGMINSGEGMTLPGAIGAISGGEAFEFKYLFKGTQPDGNGSASIGVYQMLSSSLTINGATLFSPGGQIEVRLQQNLPLAGGIDQFDVYTAITSFDDGSDFVLVDLNVIWPAGQFVTDALPTDLEPPAFVGGTMGFSNISGLMTASVTEFSVSKVPVPGGMAVLAAGGFWWGRGRQRRG